MNIRRSSAATVLAAALAVTVLAGCSTTLAGSPTAGAKVPAADESPTTSTGDSSSESSDPTTESSDTDVLPPIDPSFPTDITTSPDGGQTGGDIDADSIAWLTTFCSGFSDIMQYSAPDTTGMSADAEVQTIVDAYDAMSSAADSLATQLQSTSQQPTFPDAVVMESAILNYLNQITQVYGMGAQQIANQTITTEDQLTELINGIEAGMEQPTDDLGSAMSLVDPSVQTAMFDIPECQFLAGS